MSQARANVDSWDGLDKAARQAIIDGWKATVILGDPAVEGDGVDRVYVWDDARISVEQQAVVELAAKLPSKDRTAAGVVDALRAALPAELERMAGKLVEADDPKVETATATEVAARGRQR